MDALKQLFVALLFFPTISFAAEEGVKLDRAPIDLHDVVSLQRGARTFVNYCLTCHSAGFMRYNRLRDIGLTEQQIRDNLIFSSEAKVGDLMKVAMEPKEAKQWFGVAPPDLTVIARARSSHAGTGSDWLYTYLRGFYRDPSRPTGWNNTVFPNVGMPHVLYELQGVQVLREEKLPGPGYSILAPKLVLQQPGKLTPVEYERTVADLVNYMTYMSEPVRNTRVVIGMYVLLALAVLFVLAYLLKKEYWKDVH
ncbi:MAG TPA: cytochrome c1 [Burkholderiales bacterium]|nr:cytochrome c1 [Burkholderiales bacterium]